jgi:hypothetical protein
MDVLSRTFVADRHMTVLRHCVQRDEPAVLLTRCVRPDRPMAGEFLMMLTPRRLVVTQRTRLLQRMRLHLNLELRHLSNVTVGADERQAALEIGVTAVDGVRERFLVRLPSPEQVHAMAEACRSVFSGRGDGRSRALTALAA